MVSNLVLLRSDFDYLYYTTKNPSRQTGWGSDSVCYDCAFIQKQFLLQNVLRPPGPIWCVFQLTDEIVA